MLRRILALMFLLMFIASDSALARRHGRCCTGEVQCCCAATKTLDKPGEGRRDTALVKANEGPTPKALATPSYCLRDLYMEFQNPPHLYYCITYDNGCSGGGGYDDLWYGSPTKTPLPQSCYNPPDSECEGPGVTAAGTAPPGHEQLTTEQHKHEAFDNIGKACGWLKENYAPRQSGGHSGRSCELYEFPYAGGSIWAVMMPSPTQPGRYFGIQTDHFSGSINVVNSAVVTPNKNRTVFRVEFNGDKGLIWAKAPIP